MAALKSLLPAVSRARWPKFGSQQRSVRVPMHDVEGAPRTVQWHGWTTAVDHLPVANLLDKLTHVLRREIKLSACHGECAAHKSAENTRAEWWLSAPPAQIVEHPFIITLSVSRSRLTCCHLLQEVRFLTNVHVQLPLRRVPVLVLQRDGPTL